MIEHRGRRVELAWTLPAPGEKVWAAWTDPRHLAGWFCDRAEGVMEPGMTFTWHWDAMATSAPCTVLEVDPGKRFALEAGPMLLEVKLVGGAGPRTGLKLINSGLPDAEEEVQGTRSGWLMAVALLKKYLTDYWDLPKKQVFVWREAGFEYSHVIDLYRLPRREEWLGGAPPVLEDTGSEVALDWVERKGVLELKAFPRLGKRHVGMRATSWDGASMDVWPEAIEEALDRLQPLLS